MLDGSYPDFLILIVYSIKILNRYVLPGYPSIGLHTSSVKRKKWDGTRIPRITRIVTDDKISVGIRQIRAIRVLFQLRIENHNYLSHFEKWYALNQSNSLTDDQCIGLTSNPDPGLTGFFSNSSSSFRNFSIIYFGTFSKSFSTLLFEI